MSVSEGYIFLAGSFLWLSMQFDMVNKETMIDRAGKKFPRRKKTEVKWPLGGKSTCGTGQEAFFSESYLWGYRCDTILTPPSCTTNLYYNFVNLRSMNSSMLSATTLPKCVKKRCALQGHPLENCVFFEVSSWRKIDLQSNRWLLRVH